jgi:hypothetical protein
MTCCATDGGWGIAHCTREEGGGSAHCTGEKRQHPLHRGERQDPLHRGEWAGQGPKCRGEGSGQGPMSHTHNRCRWCPARHPQCCRATIVATGLHLHCSRSVWLARAHRVVTRVGRRSVSWRLPLLSSIQLWHLIPSVPGYALLMANEQGQACYVNIFSKPMLRVAEVKWRALEVLKNKKLKRNRRKRSQMCGIPSRQSC